MLIFDGDCGFCTVTARWLERQLRTPVPVVPWQEIPDLTALGLSTDDVDTAVYWVDLYGRTYRGHVGVGRVLRLCRGPLPAAGVALAVPPISWLGRAAYRLVANNRHRLPGATAACQPRRPASYPPPGPAGG